ncbi:hypothetical protein BaRGS_00002155 [Batillaria attramentaria]|uniref:Uncharacterized protein n=1 Tax=Batillaria attramentaria TaxID=370345 RepID=A0ABD0M4U1_9CAEN
MSPRLSVVLISTLFAVCEGALHDKVRYYEVLHSSNIHTRAKRSAGITDRAAKEVTLAMFNRTFVCHLRPRKDLFSPTFRLVVRNGNQQREVNDFNKNQFYRGSCEGDSESDVHGYFSYDGVFTGTIKYNGTVYGIEAAKRHLEEKKQGEHHGKMIAYRSDDMILDSDSKGNGHGPSFCGASHVDDKYHKFHVDLKDGEQNGDSAKRVKRQSQPYSWSTCRLVAVADYKFFRFIGDSDIYSTAAYIGGVMERVDAIYRSTVFNVGSDINGMGFEIAEQFGQNLEFTEFCVAHLFTHQAFPNNVLGLAYIASPSEGSAGGMCSPTRSIGGKTTALNTGWSTTMNSNGDVVLTQQAELVTAHGHNWGAEHDPDTSSCSPSSLFGDGKYLMYAYSVSGYDSNNNKFSSCSKSDIGAVLASKGQGCFSETPDEDNVCGNGLIDPEEECDAGYLGRFGLDPCCDSSCFLKGTSTCSPVNHGCCLNCQTAPAGTTCSSDTGVSCYNALSCPASQAKPEGATCLDLGVCDGNGVCQAFCEGRGKFSCTCDNVDESCQRCCRDTENGECKPYDNNHPLPDGRPCVIGYCESGACQKSEASMVQRLFDVFDSLTIDGVIQFFRNNMVGCVMVFSLLLWVPISIYITCQDRKKRRGYKNEWRAESREDRDFLYDEDGRKVVKPQQSQQVIPSPTVRPPRSLPPLVMSPRNQDLVHHRNRIMPL